MRIFTCSDIHGSEEIYNKLSKFTKDDCDILLLCGDLYGKDYNFSTSAELANFQENDYNLMIEVLDVLNSRGVKCYYINGNDDYYNNEDDNYHLIDPVDINGVSYIPFPFVGITPWHTNNELDEYDLMQELERLDVKEDCIIVGHMNPYGCGDSLYMGNHVGSISIREFLQNNDYIAAWLGGHIHECGLEVGEIGRTLVFNAACEYQSETLRGFFIDTDTLDFEEYKD